MLGITEKMIACYLKKLAIRKTFEVKEPDQKRPARSMPNCGSAS